MLRSASWWVSRKRASKTLTQPLQQKSNLVRPRLDQKSHVIERQEAAPGRESRDYYSHEYVSPQKQPTWSVWKKLVRQDCLRRRQQIEIPEFYVGSILAITYADLHAPDKNQRFVGRVISMEGFGTNHKILMRNKVMGTMVNIKIDVYAPIIQSIEVLRLEKWKDSKLQYLKSCDDSYCEISPDMMAEPSPPLNEKVPYFEGKVCLKSPLREVVPPVSYEEKREDPIGTAGKPTRGSYQSMIRGYNHRKARAMGANFPPYQNLFWDEHLMEEEKIHQAYIQRSSNWHRFDIMRHHIFTHEKEQIFAEMERNHKILPKISKQVGRPKVDYSKISKVWITDYDLETCQPSDPLLTYH